MAFVLALLMFLPIFSTWIRRGFPYSGLGFMFGIIIVVIGGAGTITLGVMLVKHIRDIFKQG